MPPTSLAFKRTPDGGLIEKKPRKIRISRLVREACDLIANGEVRSIQAAADRLQCSREHLSRQLGQDHVNAYLQLEAKRRISSAVVRASQVKLDLLDAVSEKVRSDVASELMAISGIQAPKQNNQTNVNVSVSAGYVIDLQGLHTQSPTIGTTIDHDADAT